MAAPCTAPAPASTRPSPTTTLRFAFRGYYPGQVVQLYEHAGLELTALRRLRIGRLPLASLPEGNGAFCWGTTVLNGGVSVKVSHSDQTGQNHGKRRAPHYKPWQMQTAKRGFLNSSNSPPTPGPETSHCMADRWRW